MERSPVMYSTSYIWGRVLSYLEKHITLTIVSSFFVIQNLLFHLGVHTCPPWAMVSKSASIAIAVARSGTVAPLAF